MKKTLFLLITALFLSTGLFAGNKSKTFDNLDHFDRIDASWLYKITLVKGVEYKVEVEYTESLEEFLSIKVKDGELQLKNIGNLPRWVERLKDPVLDVRITMPTLRAIELSGVTSLTTLDSFESADFSIDLSGVSKVKGLTVNTKNMDVEISGVAKLQLYGKTNFLDIEASGACKIELGQSFNTANLDLSGAVSFETLEVNSDRMDVETSGAVKLDLSGAVKSMSIGASGACKLNLSELTVEKMRIEMSGACQASVNVSSELSYSVSGASKFKYAGHPSIHSAHVSGASSVNSVD